MHKSKKAKRDEEEPLPEHLYTPKEMRGRTYLKQIQVYCDKLGDHLMLAAVEHKISNGMTVDPNELLEEWESRIRLPIERHMDGIHPLSVRKQDELFTRLREIHDALEVFK